jgi:hypothetical protein
MATVSLNLDRHIKASWSRTKAGGPSDNESDVMAALELLNLLTGVKWVYV